MAQTTDSPIQKPRDAKAWAKRGDHIVTLPSATQVTIRLPSLPALAKAGAIPNKLLAYITPKAAAADKGEEPSPEITSETLMNESEWRDFIISQMCVTPKVAPEEVSDLPEEDISMLSEFALRQRDTDAVGHQLAGLEVTDEWRRFRDQQSALASLLGGV
jgi:hypothetical protein